MNAVISSYLDDAHRGLQRQRAEQQRGGTQSGVQLPPLRSESPSMAKLGKDTGGSWDKTTNGSGRLGRSNSIGTLEYSKDKVDRGVQDERYQQLLQETSQLQRKLRTLQDHLAITTAKKEAFKVQATRLEKEFRRGREQMDLLQKEHLEAKRDADHYMQESQEAVKMMNEMRKSHLHEVRLLQRGLAVRSGDEKMKNRVNETADLVDKLGRAVVQRDEAVRDKAKAQGQMTQLTTDLRAVVEECTKLRRQNKGLTDKVKELQRKGTKYVPPRPEVQPVYLDESDEEFENELSTFERRFQILEEGPMGLDILASNLSRDKSHLEKTLKQQQQSLKTVENTLTDYKKLCASKDQQIETLNTTVGKIMLEHAALEEKIEEKRREVEQKVTEERERLEKQLQALQSECEDMRAEKLEYERASGRLSSELIRVHEQYEESNERKARAKREHEEDMRRYGVSEVPDEDEEEAEAAEQEDTLPEPAPEATPASPATNVPAAAESRGDDAAAPAVAEAPAAADASAPAAEEAPATGEAPPPADAAGS